MTDGGKSSWRHDPERQNQQAQMYVEEEPSSLLSPVRAERLVELVALVLLEALRATGNASPIRCSQSAYPRRSSSMNVTACFAWKTVHAVLSSALVCSASRFTPNLDRFVRTDLRVCVSCRRRPKKKNVYVLFVFVVQNKKDYLRILLNFSGTP